MTAKKRILLILVGVVVLLGVAAGCLISFFTNRNNEEIIDEADLEIYQYISCVRATTWEELHNITEENNLELLYLSENILAINHKLANGEMLNITFEHTEDAIEMVRWSYNICSRKEIDTNDLQSMEALRMDIYNISAFFENVLETTIDTVNLYSSEGLPLDSEDMENYKKLLSGEAIYDLMIRDREGMIWNARTNLSEDGVLSVHFYRSLNKEFNETRTPDIILE